MTKKDHYYCTKCEKYHSDKYHNHKKYAKNDEDKKLRLEELKIHDSEEAESPPLEEIKREAQPPQDDVIVESHSETIRFISKFIKPEYLKLEKVKEKSVLKDVLKNPIESFIFLNNKEINFIKSVLRVNEVYEILDFKNKNIYNYISSEHLKSLEKSGISAKELEHQIHKSITIATILNQLREKSIKIDKGQQKIIVAGLDQAGKTAILTTFGGKLGIDELSKLKPTKRVARQNIETDELSLFIWDFGGQSKYREDYLKNPGSYFIGVDLLIYVVDVQDYERFDESFKYLKGILKALLMLEETPHILIFIHKLDPDLREDPDIQLNVEFIKDNLREILSDITLSYEIYLTSIYSVISREPQFSKYIKEMITQQKTLVGDPTQDKVESLGEIVRSALNAIIKLSESTAKQYQEMDLRFQLLERNVYALKAALQGTPPKQEKQQSSESVIDMLLTPKTPSNQLPSNLHPPPPPGPPNLSQPVEQSSTAVRTDQINVRASIMDELKALFSKTKEINR